MILDSQRLRDLSVKWKFTLVSFGITVVVLLIVAVAFVAVNTVHLQSALVESLKQDAEVTGKNCAAALMFNDTATAREILASLGMKKGILRAAVFTPEGALFASFEKEVGNTQEWPSPKSGADQEWRSRGDSLTVLELIKVDGQTVGSIFIEMGMAPFHDNVRWVVISVAALLLLSLPVAWLIALRLQGLFTKPIFDLASAARSVSSSKDYSVRVKSDRKDELGELITVFNDMLAHIQENEAQLARHAEELEREVARRTDELSQTNELLTEELEERKVIEGNLIRAREEAEEATRLKDKFVSLVSHDLRAPLASSISSIRYLQQVSKNEEGSTAAILTGNVLRSMEGLINMIDKLLSLSRLKTGSLKVQPRFASTRIVGNQAVEKLAHLAGEKGVTLVNDVPPDHRIFVDPALFTEVLLNLISNAVKFSHQGGVVRLFVPEGNGSAVSVSDTGVGIRPEVIPLLFRHDEKTSTTGTAGERGTGLGLPFSNDIMMAHGGRITIESQEGTGSIFHLSLPNVTLIALVVDDQPVVRKEVIGHLASLKITILEADNGREALEMLDGMVPHLIITDINMPEMDGFALLKCLRERPSTREVPVIVMTALGEDAAVREKAFLHGANDFVVKPLAPEDFLPRVKRFL
ncbi:MAG: response regulator [Nitrospinae bacterium]|nr:response regulator [Nitrospinota bacterium]